MALCPFAKLELIAPGSNDPAIQVVGAILHVDAGNAYDLHDYFNGPSNGIESHFHIAKDGTIFQYRHTGYEADANLKANSFYADGVRKGFVSIETQGYGTGEWTAAQLASIKRLLAWLAETHDFPLEVCDTPFSPGVGFHTLFGSPSEWTPVSKSCPGEDRKKQFYAVLVPWMKAESAPPAVWVETRGPNVDHALKDLRQERRESTGPRRDRVLTQAIKVLKTLIVKKKRVS